VGWQDSTSGSVTDVYATGAVSGGSYIGGLVGYKQAGAITDAYATGAVSGTSRVGGLVGLVDGGLVTDSYWDTATTGQTTSFGTGLTTSALQGVLPTLQNASLWSTGPGLYPFLTAFFPNGVQAISGIAYSNSGVTPAASTGAAPTFVFVDISGVQSAVSTGANGYYYLAMPAGTLSTGGTPVVAR
jgi:hypothetical protein